MANTENSSLFADARVVLLECVFYPPVGAHTTNVPRVGVFYAFMTTQTRAAAAARGNRTKPRTCILCGGGVTRVLLAHC